MATPPTSDVQLPSITTPDWRGRLPSMLPKAEGMGYGLGGESPQIYPGVMEMAPAMGLSRSSTPLPWPGRLECARPGFPSSPSGHVDLGRLRAIYEAHRTAFWTAVADEYGAGMAPLALEQAWKTGSCCPPRGGTSNPMTPASSPPKEHRGRDGSGGQDKTRILSILGVDMEPMAR